MAAISEVLSRRKQVVCLTNAGAGTSVGTWLSGTSVSGYRPSNVEVDQ